MALNYNPDPMASRSRMLANLDALMNRGNQPITPYTPGTMQFNAKSLSTPDLSNLPTLSLEDFIGKQAQPPTPESGGAVGNFLDHLTAGLYGRFGGAMSGALDPLQKATNNASVFDILDAKKALKDTGSLFASVPSMLSGAYKGFVHPDDTKQQYEQDISSHSGLHQVLDHMATDPLMAVPMEPILSGLNQVTGASKGARFLYDLARGGLKTPESAVDGGKMFDNLVAGAKSPLSEAEAADINTRAGLDGGYVPSTPPAPAPRYTINSDPNAYLDAAINRIKPDVMQTITPPYENPKELADYVSKFSGFDAKEVSHLPYEDLRQFAEEIHGNMSSGENFLNVGKDVAGDHGFNIDNLFTGKAPNIGERVAADAQKRVYGVYPNELPKVSNPFLKAKPPETGFDMKFPLVPYTGKLEEAVPSLGKFADTYGFTSKVGNRTAENLAEKFPSGIPGLKQPLDLVGNMFQKYYGAAPELAAALKAAESGGQFDAATIRSSLTDLEKAHGLSNPELYDVIRLMEGTKTADQVSPAVVKAVEDLKGLMEKGVTGVTSGTHAEINTLLPNNKKVLGQVIDNYFPHVYKNSTKDVEKAFEKASKPVHSVEGAFNKERKFGTLDEAIAAGLKPEINPYRAIENRLISSSRSIRKANILNDMVKNPKIEHYTPSAVSEAYKHAKTGQEVGSIPSNFVQSKLAELGGRYINHADESALQQFLNPGRRWYPQNKVLAAPLKAYDSITQLIKEMTYGSIMPHMHNITYNGMYLGGADIGKVMEKAASKTLEADPIVQRAIKAGAISADAGHTPSALSKALAKMTNGLSQKPGQALWKVDKAIRAQLFEEAVTKGVSDADAAKLVNKLMVNYNNLTPFEENVMKRVFPFYSWLKGNTALQLGKWATNPAKQQLATNYAPDAISELMSGQHSKDGKVDTGVDEKGNHHLVDMYMPGGEIPKMLRDGALPFLYGKTNGVIKAGESLANNNKYYPNEWVAPKGKESMATSDPGNKVILNGDGVPASYNAANIVSLLARDMVSPLSGAVGTATDAQQQLERFLGKDKNTSKSDPNITDILAKFLGMFTSQYNPQLESKYDKRIQQSEAKDLLQYLYSTGQTPSKLDKRNAYKPIK